MQAALGTLQQIYSVLSNLYWVVFVVLGLGVTLAIGRNTPCLRYKISDEQNFFKQWGTASLFVAAVMLSPFFLAVAAFAIGLGWFGKSEKNWKWAIMIVCILWALIQTYGH